MSSFGWIALICAAASAGVYCGCIAANVLHRSRMQIPLPALLVATAVFAFSRAFAGAAPFAALSALFALLAIVQIASARSAPPLERVLACVPVAAMALVSLGQLAGNANGAFQTALAAVLCVPAPLIVAARLWDFYFVRKMALDRIR